MYSPQPLSDTGSPFKVLVDCYTKASRAGFLTRPSAEPFPVKRQQRLAPQNTESAQPIQSDDEDDSKEPNCLLLEPDFQLMQALMESQQNFTISDPSMADNPIVYASQASSRTDLLSAAMHFILLYPIL